MSNPITLFWRYEPTELAIDPDTIMSLGSLDSPGSLDPIELCFYFETSLDIDMLKSGGFCLNPYGKTYPQPLASNAARDWRELRSWGDISTMGLQINLDKANGYPEGSWQSFSKQSGVTMFNKILLIKVAVSLGGGLFHDTDQELPIAGVVYLKLRLLAPTGVDHTGLRYFNLVFDYTY